MERSRGVRRSAIRNELAAELSRRELLERAGAVGLGAAVLAAIPVAERLALPRAALAQESSDGTLEAFFDTIIPGRKAERTELGHPIHPRAIAGVDSEPGAVEADALLLARHEKIGFDTIAPAFLAELEARSLREGAPFLDLDYDARERVGIAGLAFSNQSRPLWEAAAAVAFTTFCAAANIEDANGRRRARRRRSLSYRVMGYPGVAPHGYADFSYRRRLNRGRTRRGYLP